MNVNDTMNVNEQRTHLSAQALHRVLDQQLADEVLCLWADAGLAGEGERVAQDILKRLLTPLTPAQRDIYTCKLLAALLGY